MVQWWSFPLRLVLSSQADVETTRRYVFANELNRGCSEEESQVQSTDLWNEQVKIDWDVSSGWRYKSRRKGEVADKSIRDECEVSSDAQSCND